MNALCIALHDVAPATWPQCEALLDLLDGLGASPLTLLVVPDWHARGRIDADRGFVRAIERRRARGDEIALHGYYHRDDAPPPRAPWDWLRRRVLTAGEGEFAALSVDLAEARLRRGRDLFARLDWPVEGFVAPAWLAGAGAHEAMRRVGLRWTSTHTALVDLDDERRIAAPCLTASPRSRWRRAASGAWLRAGARLVARAPLLRIGLHPADAAHPQLVAVWRELLTRLLGERELLTKTQALRRARAVASDACADRRHVEIRSAADDVARALRSRGSSR